MQTSARDRRYSGHETYLRTCLMCGETDSGFQRLKPVITSSSHKVNLNVGSSFILLKAKGKYPALNQTPRIILWGYVINTEVKLLQSFTVICVEHVCSMNRNTSFTFLVLEDWKDVILIVGLILFVCWCNVMLIICNKNTQNLGSWCNLEQL